MDELIKGKQIESLSQTNMFIETNTVISGTSVTNRGYVIDKINSQSMGIHQARLNNNMTANNATVGQKACNTAIVEFPISNIMVKINGIMINVGSGLTAYFSPDGITIRNGGNAFKGDYLYWNDLTYDLDTTDVVSFDYLVGYDHILLTSGTTTQLDQNYESLVVRYIGGSGTTMTVNVDGTSVIVGNVNGLFVWDIGGGDEHTFTTSNEYINVTLDGKQYTIWFDGFGSLIFSVKAGYTPQLWANWIGGYDTNWFNSLNWSNNILPTPFTNATFMVSNLLTHMPQIPTSGNTIAECQHIIIESGMTLKLISGSSFTVYGDVINNGNFIIDQYVEKCASFINYGSISGQTILKQTYEAIGYYVGNPMISPISNYLNAVSISSGTTSTTALYRYYNTTTDTYVTVSSGSTELLKGFSLNCGNDIYRVTHNGLLNYNDVNFTLLKTGTRYNYLSNPFASYIDMKKWQTDWNASNIESVIYTRRRINGTYRWLTYDLKTGIGTYDLVNGLLPPLTGFWVRANSTGANTFGIKKTARVHSSGQTGSVNVSNILRIKAYNATAYDETVIAFDDSGSSTYSATNDILKRLDTANAVPQIFTVKTANNLVINIMPNDPLPYTIPIALTIGAAGALSTTITATNIADFMPTVQVYLKDTVLNQEVNLRLTNYTYTASAVTAQQRFQLRFSLT